MRIPMLATLFLIGCGRSAVFPYQDLTYVGGYIGASAGSSTGASSGGGASSGTGASSGGGASGTGTAVGTSTGGSSTGQTPSSTSAGSSTGHALGTAAGGTTTQGMTAATTSSSSSTSGGTSGAQTCALGDCGGGATEIKGTLVNFCQMQAPVAGATVSNLLDPTMTTASAGSGDFDFCSPPGTALATEVVATGFVSTIVATVDPTQSTCLGQVPMVCTQVLAFAGAALPNFDASQATIFAAVLPTGSCARSGWSFHLVDSDGGVTTPPAGYQQGGGFSATATSTSASGVAVLYNIDPGLGEVQVIGTQLNGGAPCLYDGQTQGYTGAIQLQGGAFSYFPYLLP